MIRFFNQGHSTVYLICANDDCGVQLVIDNTGLLHRVVYCTVYCANANLNLSARYFLHNAKSDIWCLGGGGVHIHFKYSSSHWSYSPNWIELWSSCFRCQRRLRSSTQFVVEYIRTSCNWFKGGFTRPVNLPVGKVALCPVGKVPTKLVFSLAVICIFMLQVKDCRKSSVFA